MKKTIHRAETRGAAEHGWLSSRHTFSFANYFNPQRMGFGKLRVLNDDVIAPAAGFGTHPHDNMEIISVPITGALRHADNMGNEYVIRENEIQVMSAGTGIMHSEFNASDQMEANFLQIWVLPRQMNIEPRYDQKVFNPEQRQNQLLTVVSPNREDESLWINQDAWFSLGDFEGNRQYEYTLHKSDNGVYLFVISGQINIDGETLNKRDAVGISGNNKMVVQMLENTQLLAIEVPMH